ncbi:hypothetical protein [Amycolatopsis sp. cmx-4-54]|uniref:hypothetical protein n=1 Tax=Amycolatopsis sp. cmx-4-54 TaxID=2790936 RepID=UPI003978846C
MDSFVHLHVHTAYSMLDGAMIGIEAYLAPESRFHRPTASHTRQCRPSGTRSRRSPATRSSTAGDGEPLTLHATAERLTEDAVLELKTTIRSPSVRCSSAS